MRTVAASRSMPNLNSADINLRERMERTYVQGDFNFNPADLLPHDDFVQDFNQRYYIDFKHCVCFICRMVLIGFLILSVGGLVSDPSHILRILDCLTGTPTVVSDSDCKLEQQDKEIKYLEIKMNILNEDFTQLKVGMEKLDEWRDNLELELSNLFSQKLKDSPIYHSDVEEVIQDALSLYDADKLGVIDYALETAGGCVISTPSTTPYPSKVTYELMGVVSLRASSSPRLMIQAGNLPGQCFAFHGSTGKIRIKLSQKIQITAVTLEYAHQSLVTDPTSSPKDFKVYGLENEDDEEVKELGHYSYNDGGGSLQTFQVNPKPAELYEFVELHILNNYGHPDYTCVYRFRVHGNVRSIIPVS